MEMDLLFGLFAVGCGIYCLHGYYLLKVKKEISSAIFLPRGIGLWKCKDPDKYCEEVSGPTLALGIVIFLYGAADLYNMLVGGADLLFMVMFVIMLVTLVAFVVMIRRCNRKYFGI